MNYAPLTVSQPDWMRFLTAEGLAEKSGVPPARLAFMILKELTDNAADIGGGSITLVDGDSVIVQDAGPGIDPADVPNLFSIQRELQSSKHWRRGERGALGNGLRAVMGAVHVLGGSITVTSRGIANSLAIAKDGSTVVTAWQQVPAEPGTTITVVAPGIGAEATVERAALAITALAGRVMDGRPPPSWFDADAIADLLRSLPGVTLGDFVGQFATTYRPAGPGSLASSADPRALLAAMIAKSEREPKLHAIGADAFAGHYAKHEDSFSLGAATLPFIVEVWAEAEPQKGSVQQVETRLIVNRSASLIDLQVSIGAKGRLSFSDESFRYHLGKEQRDRLTLSQSTDFRFTIALTAPAVPILSSGKRPDLEEFSDALLTCVARAGRKAQAAVQRPRKSASVADVVAGLLPEAYDIVSGGGRYWANVRQLMYAMRPAILEETGKATVDDGYITGKLIPEFLLKNPDVTAQWKVAYDARGSFREPHSRSRVELGTVAVGGYRLRQFCAQKIVPRDVILRAPPEHRLSSILFVEKEGFAQNIEESGLLERYDCALATTKGMSVVALRALIDDLAGRIPGLIVFTLTDFDIAGVTIEDTLLADGWRHQYEHSIQHVPLAVSWPQARRLAADGKAEPSGRDNARSFARGLARKGLPVDAVEFLTSGGPTGNGQRVELNAILPGDLLDTIGAGLERNLGGQKVLPDRLDGYWRELSIRRELARHEATLRARPAAPAPPDLREAVASVLQKEPRLSWDEALARLIDGEADEAS